MFRNSMEEHSPCAIIITRAPVIPLLVMDIILASVVPIWQTEEYAIIAFRSVCCVHTILMISAPVSPMFMIVLDDFFATLTAILIILMIL